LPAKPAKPCCSHPRNSPAIVPVLTLQSVVADGGGCGEALLDVALLEQLPRAIRMMAPDASEAVRLQFQPHRQFVRLGLTDALLRAPFGAPWRHLRRCADVDPV
jgi:hypothetical protein